MRVPHLGPRRIDVKFALNKIIGTYAIVSSGGIILGFFLLDLYFSQLRKNWE